MLGIGPILIYEEIPGFPGYKVGNDGSVWSCFGYGSAATGNPYSKNVITDKWKRLKQFTDKNGYLMINLWKDGKSKTKKVHRLILETFISPPPYNKSEVLHKDDNPANNYLYNLSWGTCQDNKDDMVRKGRSARGSKHGAAKLTEQTVCEIIEKLENGAKAVDLSKDYHIGEEAICKIKFCASWKHLPRKIVFISQKSKLKSK